MRRWLDDTSPAEWVLPRLGEFGTVAGVMPTGYEAYLRIMHPVEDGDGRQRRWSDIARESGRIVHAGMQLHMINRAPGTVPRVGYEPGPGYVSGSLQQPARDVLVDHLVRATATPDRCWFLLWECTNGVGDGVGAARVGHPARAHLLATGSVNDARRSMLESWDQSPTMWWPDDRAWFVSTEVDFAWTYVGGSLALVADLLDENRLEPFLVTLTDDHTYYGDVLNGAL